MTDEEWGHAVAQSEFDYDDPAQEEFPIEREELTLERIKEMLSNRQFKELKEELENNIYPVDLADILEEVDEKQLVLIFRLLVKEEAAETFTYMNSDLREFLINALTDSELEEVMEEMYLDDTVDVLEEMPANVVDRLLMVTDEERRAQINQLLQYPEDSAGSVMNVDYIALNKEMTVEEAILKIRQVGLNRETIYTCYVTEKRRLIGAVDIKDLLTTGESRVIEEIMDTNMLYGETTEDQEEVARTIMKYGLIALPIVDHEHCMVGIVTVDDAMLVLQEEETEDISIMAGVNPNDESYFGTTVLEHVKSRIPWLLFLMLSATVTQMIMNNYESAIAVMPQLTGFIPMLTGTGGNCGSQSSALMIRGLAVGEIEFKDLFKIIWKEIRVAISVSLILAVINGCRIMLMGQGDVMMAATIGITMACTVIIAKIVGCTLPLVAKKVGLDPAIMATPLISTLVDISTISVYFAIISAAFKI
ncbi:MAG: magnesium transporter [Dorea sp.]|nr:magnesium transporter [Dorea sp.]